MLSYSSGPGASYPWSLRRYTLRVKWVGREARLPYEQQSICLVSPKDMDPHMAFKKSYDVISIWNPMSILKLCACSILNDAFHSQGVRAHQSSESIVAWALSCVRNGALTLSRSVRLRLWIFGLAAGWVLHKALLQGGIEVHSNGKPT